MKNPFIISGYEGPDYFCDREKETERLTEAANNYRNLVLASVRRLGKSGLIHNVQHHLKKAKEIVPVYFDIMPTSDLASFTRIFAKNVFEQTAGITLKSLRMIKSVLTGISPIITVDKLTYSPEIEIKLNNEGEARQTLEDVFRYLGNEKKHFYIAIDEFQQINDYPETNTEALLRTYIQRLNNVTFVFSGSKKDMLIRMFTDAGKPFYQSSEFFELKKINYESYIKFIKKKFYSAKIQMSNDIIIHLLDQMRCHTFYVQYLCNRIFSKNPVSVKKENIDKEIFDILNNNESVYHNYRNLLTNRQWELLRAIAKEDAVDEPTSNLFLKKYGLNSPSTIQQAIKSLTDKELIYRENKSYYITDVFFSHWLKRQ